MIRAMPVRHSSVEPFVVFLIGLAVALMFQGARGLWDPDEGRYSDVALQMVDSGDYMMPRRNDDALHVTKPPVIYWLMAGSVDAFGRSEWSLRLPMALAFALTVALVFSLGRTFVPQSPWLPTLIYLSSPLPFLAAGTITTDTVLACVETAATLAYVRFRFAAGTPRWLDLMWALFGLAFMVKGPPALLPLLAIAAWEFRVRSLALIARPLGILAFALIGLSWFALIINQHPELLSYFVGHEVVGRLASVDMDRHGQWYGGFLVYLPTLALGALPWAGIAVWRRRSKPSLQTMAANSRFLWLWFVLPLIVFFLARSRLPYYLLPLFVPLSLLIGQALADLNLTRVRILLALAWLSVLLSVKLFVADMSNPQDARALAKELQPIVTDQARELVFVETKARYGLRYYLNTEIEKVSLSPLPPGQLPSDATYDDDLAHELAEHEPGVVFLIPPAKADAFVARVRESQLVPRKIGAVKRLTVYVVDPIKS